jgi:hypothetical protein
MHGKQAITVTVTALEDSVITSPTFSLVNCRANRGRGNELQPVAPIGICWERLPDFLFRTADNYIMPNAIFSDESILLLAKI